ncbi:DUF3592 domain-containing protein [Spirosoma pomorum]
MTARELRPIFAQVAQQTLSVADAERYLQLHHSPTARRFKSGITGLVLLLFLGVGLFLIYHGYRVSTSQQGSTPSPAQLGTAGYWLPLLLFGGFGSLLVLVSSFGLASLLRAINNPVTPSLASIQFLLSQVATRTSTVDDAIQQLFPTSLPEPTRGRSSVATRFLFSAFLLAVIYFSLQQGSQSYRLLVNGQSTNGLVIDMVSDRKGHTSAPVVRYSVNGTDYELTGTTYSNPPAYTVGDRVTVLYNPASPDEGAIRFFTEQWVGPLVAITLAGFFLFLFWRRQRSASNS